MLLGGLGTSLYMIFFLVQTEYWLGFLFSILSIFLIYKYIQNSKPQPKIILSQDGIQIVGQPFVAWSMVHGLQIKPHIKGNEYSEIFVFTNNGRIQEFPIAKLAITSWQLERLLEEYQIQFREQMIDDREQITDDRE
jgi:hypothetical protein